MSEFSQISRLQEENRKALLERQQRLLTCERFKEDYGKLEALLQSLPNKTTHEVMVPFGSVAFMPGKLVHTNEIMVLLGDNWFAERSASQALEIVTRRKKYLEKNIAGINEDLKNFQSTLNFASEIQSVAEENSEVKEIKEELSPQEEERLLNRHFRKAHPKAKRFGGTKKVEGLKSNLTDKVRNIEKTVQIVSSEDLSLFARLDELEEKETKNAELDQLWQDDSDSKENVIASGCSKEGGDTREGLPQKQDTNQTKKKVTWEAHYVKNEAVVSSSDSSGSDDDDDGVQSTISVKFSSLSVPLQGEIPKQSPEKPTVESPADIYSQFASKKGLKSILRKPSVEENDKKNSEQDKSATTQQPPTNIAKENTQKEDFNSQKAFTGTIVEKPVTQKIEVVEKESSPSQVSTSQPGKKLSRFKAARQKQQ